MAGNCALVVAILALAYAHALAYDPSPLQDFCIADTTKDLFVNGFPCKDPKKVTPDDFVFSGIGMPADTDNMVGSNVTNVNVLNFPGMNTLGISLARIDYAPNGLNPPHTHPRATEVLTLLEGELFAGFVTAPPPAGRLFAKMLKKGDVIIFPFGQIHFQMNVGRTPAVALSSLSSQFPGVIQIAPTLFGSDPEVPKEVLARAFQIDANLVGHLQKIFKSGSGRNY